MSSTSNILYGGYEGSDCEICENSQSLGEVILNKFRALDDKIVLVDGKSGEEVSARSLLSKSICLAQYLQQKFGIATGDVVSICSENSIEFAITVYATILLGATIAPLNHSYIEDEMNHAIKLSKPTIVFVSPMNLNKVIVVTQKHTFVKQIILYDNSIDSAMNVTEKPIPFSQIIKTLDYSKINEFKCKPQNMKENVMLLLCSSGTTGLPKCVQLTQFNMLVGNVQFHQRLQHLETPTSGERIVLGNLPMFHAFGMCVFITTLLGPAAKIVLLPRFVEEDFLRCIMRFKINTAFLVPPILVFLAKSPLIRKYDLSNLHVIWCGAAPLSEDIETEVKKRIGIRVVRQGYGMTEGTFALCAQDDVHHSKGSVGVLLKGIYGRVVDVETGKCLGPKEIGELHFKGPNVMKGYIGNKQATSETVDADGWLHTGDVGYFDDNGEWYICDRIKELIKYNGFQVPPSEIEALLLTHPQIRDVGVVGLPNELTGEAAFAFVVKQPGAKISENDIITFVAKRLSKPKRLHGGVKFVDAIPKNVSGKILRRILRDMIKNHKSKL